VTLVFLIAYLVTGQAPEAPAPFEVRELAGYRLTARVFERFETASRLIADATRREPRFASDPLFTREIVLAGEAPEMAALLETRLRSDPALAGALRSAKLAAREYTTFAIALFGARLAHGFVQSGALRRVPPGVTADNVAFVEVHEAEIGTVLRDLGLVD
jgi:hypothetical protein